MKNVIFEKLRTVLVIATILSVLSCSNDDDLGNLSDTIFVRHKNADMPAYIHGNGTKKVFLIILHGGPGDTGLSYRFGTFKNKIEKEYAVVYFDQRGSGMSQGNYSENGISVDIMAEDVLALVKVMKRKYGNDSRFFLMGHSWGGTLGTATVLKDQNEFLGWIAVDGLHNPSGMYSEYISTFKKVAAEQIELGNNISFWEGTIDLANNVTTEYRQDHFFDMNNRAFKAERRLVADNVINKVENDSDTFFNYNFITTFWNRGNTISILTNQGLWENLSYTNRLSEIKIPSLILWGKYDIVVPATFAQEAYDNLGSDIKELIIFERSGHAPMLSEADKFAEELIRFMNQNK
ncbi:alpha/beta fold hydrolase [Aquimarina sp. Aq78]|uniref:alpha/beta fold hydrolase n=1 Tax=Aquimarina sp. Aq78 TaxID=1191889 RepID=UPI000D0E9A27|nr:alpha/beta hydrolase [Aquimarina sp. Aq78]